MCIYCCTFIQLNDYWMKRFGLAINKKNYISIDNWGQLVNQKSVTIKDMNNMIKELHLETEVSLIDEDEDEDEHEDGNGKKWIQRQEFFDYCLEDIKKGQSDIVKSVGKIIPTEITDQIIDSCGNDNCKPICTNIPGWIVYAYEKGDSVFCLFLRRLTPSESPQ